MQRRHGHRHRHRLLLSRSQPPTSPLTKASSRRQFRETRARVAGDPHRPGLTAPFRLERLLQTVLLTLALLLPVVFNPWAGGEYALTKLRVLQVGTVLALAVAGLQMSRGILRRLDLRVVDIAVLAFLVLNLAAWMLSADARRSLYGEERQYLGIVTVGLLVVTFYLARFAFARLHRAQRLAGAVAVAATAVAGYAVVQQVGLDPVFYETDFGAAEGGARVWASIGEPNALGAYLVLGIAVTAGLLFTSRWWARLLAGGAIVAMVVGIAFTFSRGAYLGLAAAAVVFVLVMGWSGTVKAGNLIGALITLVGTVVLLIAAVEPVRDAATDVWDRALTISEVEETGRTRFDLWDVGIEIALDNPILGTGQDTYPEQFAEYRESVLPPERAAVFEGKRAESPHNLFIAIAAGAGIPALFAFLVIVGALVVALLRRYRRSGSFARRAVIASLVAAVFGYLVTNQFMTQEIAGSWLFWAVLGVGAGLTDPREYTGSLGDRGRIEDPVVPEVAAPAPAQTDSVPD